MALGIAAGLRYGAEAFALGCVLGVIRVTWLVSAIGELPAVLSEIPVMLLAMGWRACVIVRRHQLVTTASRAAMGGVAFALLMGCELGLAIALGLSPGKWFTSLGTPAGMTGLAGQVIIAALPMLVRRGGRSDGQ